MTLSKVVYSLGHYRGLEQAALWERWFGKHAGRLNVVGDILEERENGTMVVGWFRGGQMVESVHFSDNLERVG